MRTHSELNRFLRSLVILAALGWSVAAQGQYSANFQTNTISGVTSNWSGNYYVGYTDYADVLIVSNNAALTDAFGFLGYWVGSSNNTAIVIGSGSIWSNSNFYVGNLGSGNTLTIASSGTVYSAFSSIGTGVETSPNTLSYSSNNTVTVTGTGSVWNSGDLIVGYYGFDNSLIITNGGTVRGSTLGNIGAHGGGNAVTVTSHGSVWNLPNVPLSLSSSNNSLTIANGGAVLSLAGTIGGNNNAVTVTDPGSLWNVGYILIGAAATFAGSGNSLIITNGGAVYNTSSDDIGYSANDNNNAVVVTGSGSVWNTTGGLYVGYASSGNTLTIADGSAVTVGGTLYVGFAGTNNQMTVTGGSLTVTNGAINVEAGQFAMSGGIVLAQQLIATTNISIVNFSSGWLTSGGTAVTNGLLFVVGDGTDAAILQLAGGVHSFANNLEITSNATLTGCGTINGNVTIDPGAAMLLNCGGTLSFTGILTNNGLVQAIDGSVLESYGTVINNGTIDINNGTTNFHGVFINNGTLLTASSVIVSQASQSGQDFVVQVPSVTGHTYQMQYSVTLPATEWINTGGSLAGTGGVLTFTDPGGATNLPARFYHVQVTAP